MKRAVEEFEHSQTRHSRMDGISDHKVLDLNCSYDSRQLFCVLSEMQISWARCHEGKILFIDFVFQYGVEIIINFPEKAQHDQESSKKHESIASWFDCHTF